MKHIRIGHIIFFWILFSSVSEAQTVQQTFQFAERQFLAENYKGTIDALNRVLFFDEEEFIAESYHLMGDSYLKLGDYFEAADQYNLAWYAELNDSVKNELSFKKALSLILQERYKFAYMELLQLDSNTTSYFDKKRNFYLGVVNFYLEDFSRSRTYFSGAVDTSKVAQKQINDLFERNRKIRINPKTAKILSLIIPGMGQFYAGSVKEGLNSFLLNAGILALGFHISVTYSVLDAALAVLPWYQRYYTGGVNNAESIARKKLTRKRNDVYRELIDVVHHSSQSRR